MNDVQMMDGLWMDAEFMMDVCWIHGGWMMDGLIDES
jgi:hypothetical protein